MSRSRVPAPGSAAESGSMLGHSVATSGGVVSGVVVSGGVVVVVVSGGVVVGGGVAGGVVLGGVLGVVVSGGVVSGGGSDTCASASPTVSPIDSAMVNPTVIAAANTRPALREYGTVRRHSAAL